MALKPGLCTFIHIPKTGGITLHDILSRIYPKQRTVHIPGIRKPVREFALQHANDTAPFLVKGHIALNQVTGIPGNFLFTFLRPPISRVISHYYFLKEQPSVKHYAYLNEPGTTIESFYALKDKPDIDNCLVRYLSGDHEVPFGEIGEEHLQRALHNLEHTIDFFGLQEFYDESLIMLAGKLGWPLPVYRKKNITKKKEEVSPETLEFLKRANQWDIRFYDAARIIFLERMKQMTPAEHKRLARLKMFNKLARLYPF